MRIVGNDAVISTFLSEKESGKLSHAFIIEGPRGSGRLTLARALASAVLCEEHWHRNCTCRACTLVLSGSHPDVHEIVFKARTGQIKIDEIRELIASAHVKPSEGGYNIFIIENAQMMNGAAQTALLQMFEEPPPATVIFLLTTDRELILKTLVSRARVIRTQRLCESDAEQLLSALHPEADTQLLRRFSRLTDGAVGEAEELLADADSAAVLKTADAYLDAVSNGARLYELSGILSPSKKMTRESLSLFCAYLEPALRDVVLAQLGALTHPVFFKECDTPKRIARRFDTETLLAAFDTARDVIVRASVLNIAAATAHLNSFFASDTKQKEKTNG